MKICQITDTHLGITKRKSIVSMCKDMSNVDFDIILHTGDYCGGVVGNRTLGETVRIIRKKFPDKPFISVIGNHDYWVKGRKKSHPSLADFEVNLQKIREIFKLHNVWFLDDNGPYRNNSFPGVVIVGHSGWYKNLSPQTNDATYLPFGIEGHTHGYLFKKASQGALDNLDKVNKLTDSTVVYVSHFPVIRTHDDEGFDLFSGDPNLGRFIQEEYQCRYFFSGHDHKRHVGPLMYSPGSDYYKPAFHVVEIRKS